jgi:ribosome-binding factor A
MAKRSKRRSSSSRPTTTRDYPRTARLNELVREILAEELERVDDTRLELVTFTSVDVDADLLNAKVYYDCLEGEDGDAEALEALDEARIQLQRSIARQAHIKRTPHLTFAPDPAIRAGLRIETILRDMPPPNPANEGFDPDRDPGAADDASGEAEGR